METIPGTAEIIRALKEAGKNIYLLSNASMRLLSIYKEVIPAVECFSGIFYSAAHKCVKPQDIIYERFLKEYSLSHKLTSEEEFAKNLDCIKGENFSLNATNAEGVIAFLDSLKEKVEKERHMVTILS